MKVDIKEAKQVSDTVYELIPKSNNREKDLLAPWFKISRNFDINDPTASLFSRYIVFYLRVITSGDDEGFITTNTMMSIGKELTMETKGIENSIKELVRLNMLFKIKNGHYQVNQKHLNKKQNVKESNASIKSQNIQNNIVNNNISDSIVVNNPSVKLMDKLIALKEQKQRLINL